MAKQSLNTIKNWFRTRLKPTQAQFWDTWDSFWHKDEMIPTSKITNLDTILTGKASQEGVDNALNGKASTQQLADAVDGITEVVGEKVNYDDFTNTDDITWAIENVAEEGKKIKANTVGFTGVFLSDGKNVTVVNGLIKSIETLSQDGLILIWDDIANVPVADASSVADWNTFFDLPVNGTTFSGIAIDGNIVTLTGGSGITLKDSLFGNSGHGGSLIKIEDKALCVTHASDFVFSDENGEGCYNLTDIRLPALLSAGDGCFSYCSLLSTLLISECLSLGINCFAECHVLAEINLPFNTFESLPSGTFSGCLLINNLTFPNVTTLGDYCFSNCESLLNINLNFDGFTALAKGVFQFCHNQSFSFINVLTVGESCFSHNPLIETLNLPSAISFDQFCMEECPTLNTFTSPSLQTVGDYCFRNCVALQYFNSVFITSLGIGAFEDCSSATLFNFPLLESIGGGCFLNCSSATLFNYPALTSGGSAAFSGCSSATVFDLPELLIVSASCFDNCISAIEFNLQKCNDMGTSNLLNHVFLNIAGNNISITIPIALMTCNGGNPDGDIQYLQTNNTVTIVTV